MQPCKTSIANFAAHVVEHWVKTGTRYQTDEKPDFSLDKAACFVSLHTHDGSLRGCIGTLEPRYADLAEEIIENAIAAAHRDSRFKPVRPDELEGLIVTVDVLSAPEPTTPENLDPAIYGLILSDGHLQRGVLLPALDGVNTAEEQIRIVKRKAGLSNVENGDLKFYRFTSIRYD